MKKIILIMIACLALLCGSAFAQTQEQFDFTGLGVGVTLNTFNGETPQNLEKGWTLEMTPVFKFAQGWYAAPMLNYSRQYQTAGFGGNVFYLLGESDNFKMLVGTGGTVAEVALSADSTDGVQYNNVITGELCFVIQWRNLYGMSPTLVLNQSWSKAATSGETLVPKPVRETSVTVGLMFGAKKSPVVLAQDSPTMANRVFSEPM